MSTRYVWGQYTREIEYGYTTTYTYTQEQVNYYAVNVGTGFFNIGTGYTFSESTGEFYYTNYRTEEWGLYSVYNSGYITLTSGNMIYGTRWRGAQSGKIYTQTAPVSGEYSYLYEPVSQTERYSYYVRGSFIKYISSSSSNSYPSNDYTGSYWYVYQGSDSIDPVSITLSEEIFGGESTTITLSPSTDKRYSGTVSYIYQYRFNEGNWNTLTTSTSTTASLAVPIGMNTVQVRVQAKDDLGFTSTSYIESDVVEIINGDPPYFVWSFTDNPHDMGEVTEPFQFTYTVMDPDVGNTMTVSEALTFMSGDRQITLASHTYQNVNIGTDFIYDAVMDEVVFQQCPTDDITTITLNASDNYNLVAEPYVVTFTKFTDEVTITLKEALAVEGDITEGVVYITAYIPEDATFWVKVTNNANDETPIWQDVTEDVLHNRVFQFENAIAENGAAFNFQLYAKRGESKEKGYIDTIMGAFK